MRAHLLAGPASVRSIHHRRRTHPRRHRCRRHCHPVASSWRGPAAAIGSEQNHYDVLGLVRSATPVEIKRAYRLLALKCHPDISKDLRAGEIFKSIRRAYEGSDRQYRGRQSYGPEDYDEVRIYKWAKLRRKMQEKKYWDDFNDNRNESFSYYETDYEAKVENTGEQRESFAKVLRSAFLLIFLMQTLGCWLSLTFSSLMAFLNKKLDAGYKMWHLADFVPLICKLGLWENQQ